MMEEDPGAFLLDPVNHALGGLDSGVGNLIFHVLKERLLHSDFSFVVDPACGFELRGVGENGFAFGEIFDRGEGTRAFVEDVIETCFFGLHGCGKSGDSATDDRDIDGVFFLLLAGGVEIALGEDGLNGLGTGIRGKLKKRNPAEVTDDANSGNIGESVFADFGKFFDGAGGPLAVEPVVEF